jgi:hypothetical protein
MNLNGKSSEIAKSHKSEKKRLNEVVQIVSNVPPDSIIQQWCSRTVVESFLSEKQKNFFVADRIASKIEGIEPKYEVPPHLGNLVKALAAFHNAQYNLIYECWDDLKKAAIKQQLIPGNAQPKDFYKLMLEAHYIDAYSKLQNDVSTDKQRLNSQQKQINRDLKYYENCACLNAELDSLIEPENDPSKSHLENLKIAEAYREQRKKLNYKVAAMQKAWGAEYGTLSQVRQLFFDVVDAQCVKSNVVATANNFYKETIKDKLRAEYEYYGFSFLRSLSK